LDPRQARLIFINFKIERHRAMGGYATVSIMLPDFGMCIVLVCKISSFAAPQTWAKQGLATGESSCSGGRHDKSSKIAEFWFQTTLRPMRRSKAAPGSVGPLLCLDLVLWGGPSPPAP